VLGHVGLQFGSVLNDRHQEGRMIRTRHPVVRLAMVLLGGALMITPPAASQRATHSMSPTEKIANAMSAAPTALASLATIMDWPASDSVPPAVLRQGSNGWSCLPDMPDTQGNDPMCLDKSWQAWVQAYVTHKPPQLSGIGVSYMIAPGYGTGSNTDPYATGPTADNQWGHDAPHLMIVVPDVAALQGLPTTRQDGAPFVMWTGTPYAHIMVPLAANSGAAPARH
jgi:hypothetical protein